MRSSTRTAVANILQNFHHRNRSNLPLKSYHKPRKQKKRTKSQQNQIVIPKPNEKTTTKKVRSITPNPKISV